MAPFFRFENARCTALTITQNEQCAAFFMLLGNHWNSCPVSQVNVKSAFYYFYLLSVNIVIVTVRGVVKLLVTRESTTSLSSIIALSGRSINCSVHHYNGRPASPFTRLDSGKIRDDVGRFFSSELLFFQLQKREAQQAVKREAQKAHKQRAERSLP